MSDIFISYSRKDSEQALQLAELLQSAGLSCWIDTKGIELATNWSAEIVDAIDECRAFIILLSRSSAASHNVAKELALASERRKKILPLELEPIELPREFAYQLAGIQRSPMTSIESVIQALGKIGLEATGAPIAPLIPRPKDARKSLMILPFEDLSPTQDNGWFADGLVSEMIDKLSNVKSLRLIDRQTSLQIKKKGHTIAELATILEVRYFIEGSIRKFGEQIKISSALLDFDTGDYLWQDSYRGVFADIFAIQEAIAERVVSGLKLHLGAAERAAIGSHLTENAEAYEFFLKGNEAYEKHTLEGLERAIPLYEEATVIEPQFAAAFAVIANTHLQIYRIYDRNAERLNLAEQAILEVERIEGRSKMWCWIMSRLFAARSNEEEAEHYARQAIGLDRDFALGYDALASALKAQNRLHEASEAYREQLRLQPETVTHINLLMALDEANDKEGLRRSAIEALPLVEKDVKLNPGDGTATIVYASTLLFAGRTEDARMEAVKLAQKPDLDGYTLYNLACLFCALSELESALTALARATQAGFSEIELLRRDPSLDPLRELTEFHALLKEVEDKIAAHAHA